MNEPYATRWTRQGVRGGLLACAAAIAMGGAAAAPWDNPLLNPDEANNMRSARGIYGSDDRIEVSQASRGGRLAAAATAALIKEDKLTPASGGYRVRHEAMVPLSTYGVCRQERFAEQPVVAFCSAFLVDRDLVATAGHCAESCADMRVVFGFQIDARGEPVVEFSADNVYRCAEVISREFRPTREHGQHLDWALLRLDRPVAGRTPLAIWGGREPPMDEPLAVIGYPLGIPEKIASGGRVMEQARGRPLFVTDLDTYQGNSGSPVFTVASVQANDPMVVGILVSGAEDFDDKNKACMVSSHCAGVKVSANRRCTGEMVTKSAWMLESVGSRVATDDSSGSPPVTQPSSAPTDLEKILPGLFN